MDIRNDTPFVDGLALGMGPDRQAHLGVLLKGTFRMPETPDAVSEPADEQLEIVTGDEFFDGDVLGSVQFEAEHYVYKPRADVALIGSAHAPGGRPHTACNVALRVGRYEWALRVIGDRQWIFPSRAVLVPLMSDPAPFTRMPLRYERSFGGFDHRGRAWCKENPIGRGFIGRKTRESVHESSLPNVEDPRAPIRSWDDQPSPVGFGFIRKDWAPRSGLSGRRIDDLHDTFGLPADFDHAYFNGAHPGLQIPFLKGDEEVELQHLTPDGYRRFRLPGLMPQVAASLFTDGRTWDEILSEEPDELPDRPLRVEHLGVRLDTLVLLPDDYVFYLVWRANMPVADLTLEEVAALHITLSAPTGTSAPALQKSTSND